MTSEAKSSRSKARPTLATLTRGIEGRDAVALSFLELEPAEMRSGGQRSARLTTSISSSIFLRCSALLPDAIACSTQWET